MKIMDDQCALLLREARIIKDAYLRAPSDERTRRHLRERYVEIENTLREFGVDPPAFTLPS